MIFPGQFATDTTQAMVINEATAKLMGYTSPEQALGKKFDQWGTTRQDHWSSKRFSLPGIAGAYQAAHDAYRAGRLPTYFYKSGCNKPAGNH